jgi:segregation and condensation protein B
VSTDLKRIVEAVLFAAETPLSLAQICQILETKDKAPVQSAIEELCREYDYLERAFELVEVAGGWRLRTRPEMAFWLRKLKRQSATRLSRASLETLAIIAYKQPVLKAEIERIRGVEVSGVLRMLMEKDLVRVVGRKDLPGRPLIYGTTKRFLEVFDLKDLRDLPTLEEMQDLLGEPDVVVEGEQEEAPLFTRGMAGQDDDDVQDEEPEITEAQDSLESDSTAEETSATEAVPQEQYSDQALEEQPQDSDSGPLELAGPLPESGGDALGDEGPYKIEPTTDAIEHKIAEEKTADMPDWEPEAEPKPTEPFVAPPEQVTDYVSDAPEPTASSQEPADQTEEASSQGGPGGDTIPKEP